MQVFLFLILVPLEHLIQEPKKYTLYMNSSKISVLYYQLRHVSVFKEPFSRSQKIMAGEGYIKCQHSYSHADMIQDSAMQLQRF
jgi:hypothetical protein